MPPVNWAAIDPQLGTMTDVALAQQTGHTALTLMRRRHRLQIPRFNPPPLGRYGQITGRRVQADYLATLTYAATNRFTPTQPHVIHQAVMDDYGAVCLRTIYIRLVLLVRAGRLIRLPHGAGYLRTGR